jgi:hypothetical protein
MIPYTYQDIPAPKTLPQFLLPPRAAPTATSAQPPSNASPPIGVTGPSQPGPPNANTYNDPENNVTPTPQHPAAHPNSPLLRRRLPSACPASPLTQAASASMATACISWYSTAVFHTSVVPRSTSKDCNPCAPNAPNPTPTNPKIPAPKPIFLEMSIKSLITNYLINIFIQKFVLCPCRKSIALPQTTSCHKNDAYLWLFSNLIV